MSRFSDLIDQKFHLIDENQLTQDQIKEMYLDLAFKTLFECQFEERISKLEKVYSDIKKISHAIQIMIEFTKNN